MESMQVISSPLKRNIIKSKHNQRTAASLEISLNSSINKPKITLNRSQNSNMIKKVINSVFDKRSPLIKEKQSQSYSKLPSLSKLLPVSLQTKKTPQRCIFKTSSKIHLKVPDVQNKPKTFDTAVVTQTGSVCGKQKNNNQDSFICLSSLPGIESFQFFCVLDGHGPNGHIVSKYLHNHYPEILKKYYSDILNFKTEEKTQYYCKKTIRKLEKSLKNSKIDISYSGSTLLSVLLIQSWCICVSIGDSRGIIGVFDKSWG